MTNGLNQSYAYDSFGNILQNGGFTDSYTANNQMFGYAYDASGNLLADDLGDVMTWDAEGRLSSAGGATYIYDAEGNRVEKQGVGVTDTVYLGGRPIARYAAGQWTDLIYGPTGLLAEVPGTQTGAPVFRVTDHLGNSVGSLLANGTFVNPVDYTPFGQVFSGETSDPYLFTGYERDPESGFDYASARDYASNTGRFMSPDPSGLMYADQTNPQSFDLYSYALNNPLRFTDPSGLTVCDWGSSDTHPGDDYDDDSDCAADGGTVVEEETTVTVRPDGNSGCSGVCGEDPMQWLADWGIDQFNALQQQQGNSTPTPQQYVNAISQAIKPIPQICGFGAAYYVGGRVGVGVSADTKSGIQRASGANIVNIPFGSTGFGIKSNITFSGGANGNISYQAYALGGAAGIEVGTHNGDLLNSIQSVSVVASVSPNSPHNVTAYANISSIGDSACHP